MQADSRRAVCEKKKSLNIWLRRTVSLAEQEIKQNKSSRMLLER